MFRSNKSSKKIKKNPVPRTNTNENESENSLTNVQLSLVIFGAIGGAIVAGIGIGCALSTYTVNRSPIWNEIEDCDLKPAQIEPPITISNFISMPEISYSGYECYKNTDLQLPHYNYYVGNHHNQQAHYDYFSRLLHEQAQPKDILFIEAGRTQQLVNCAMNEIYYLFDNRYYMSPIPQRNIRCTSWEPPYIITKDSHSKLDEMLQIRSKLIQTVSDTEKCTENNQAMIKSSLEQLSVAMSDYPKYSSKINKLLNIFSSNEMELILLQKAVDIISRIVLEILIKERNEGIISKKKKYEKKGLLSKHSLFTFLGVNHLIPKLNTTKIDIVLTSNDPQYPLIKDIMSDEKSVLCLPTYKK